MLPRGNEMWWATAIEAPDPAALARFYVDLLGWRVRLGATVAAVQPNEHVRVLFDPAGHPFCLCLDED